MSYVIKQRTQNARLISISMTKPPVNHWPDCIFVKINFVSGLACAAATTRCKSTPDKDMTRWSQLKRKIGVSSELD